MLTVLLVFGLLLSIVLMIMEKEDWVTAYETHESNVGDAQTIHCLFKAYNIETSYSYKMNKRNFSMTFHRYEEGTFTIKVPKKDQAIAQEALLTYNVLESQKERAVIRDI